MTPQTIKIPLYEGSELSAELQIEDDKAHLKYLFKGKEFTGDSMMESVNSKVFDCFIFIARGICVENSINLWSY